MGALKHMVKPNFILKQGRNIGECGLHGPSSEYFLKAKKTIVVYLA